MLTFVLLCTTGFLAGVINSVAGGGALMIFPLLISMGVPATTANASTSIGVFGGQTSSAFGYREYLRKLDRRFFLFLFIGVIGGVLGAMFLDKTSDDLFVKIAPWFIVFATASLIFQSNIQKWLLHIHASPHLRKVLLPVLILTAIVVSIYGGYFGAGMGIIIFAIISLAEVADVNTTNGMKNLMTIAINLSANIYFVFAGMVAWSYALPILLSSAAGGYVGSTVASRIPGKYVRLIVIIIGFAASVVLFIR